MRQFQQNEERVSRGAPRRAAAFLLPLLALLVGLLVPVDTPAFDIEVVGPDGTPVTDFRWLVEEDATYGIEPGVTCLNGALQECASVSFHRSYVPPVAAGDSTNTTANLPSDRRYFVSVLPAAGYSIGGAPVAVGQASVTVLVQPEPIPTSQIRIFVFEDRAPTNNAPDRPEEPGLEGFQLFIEDAGGRYGISAGQMMMDAFGNPVGTTYDALGEVITRGNGVITTDADGIALVKNLAPGKFGIKVIPPAEGQSCDTLGPNWTGSGKWQQVSTIEGTKTIDAWVKANEPPFFAEFGPPGPHVFVGFVRDCQKDLTVDDLGNPILDDLGNPIATATISGQVRSIHNSRPPDYTFHTGPPVPSCWVALNDLAVGIGRTVYAAPCYEDSSFAIPGIPAGNYQLSFFDSNLDMIIGSLNVTVGEVDPGTGDLVVNDIALGEVPIFAWFSRLEAFVFNDKNANGFWDQDQGELGLPEQNVNIRWRDGSIYQSLPTDLTGAAPFEEVFPFFSWLVAEVDYARLQATGATFTADAGGAVAPGEVLNPQPQTCTAEDAAAGVDNCGTDGAGAARINPITGDSLARTETGVVLTQAFQGFLGQTNRMEFGKKPYGRGENGGISGMVLYATTRAEDDPRYAATEPWEPGIPRIQVNLYLDADRDGAIDDLDGDGSAQKADVDNHPFGWRDGVAAKGAEDYDWDGDGSFDAGDALQIVTTDSWDDSVPTGCQGETFWVDGNVGDPAYQTDCFDGIRNFNQIRPGVFDGGYAFETVLVQDQGGTEVLVPADTPGAVETAIPSGAYIVESGRHPVYQTVREQDRNVDFGDEYVASELLLPPVCVGEANPVPAELVLFPGVEAGFANTERPLCDRKQVRVKSGMNAAVDFYFFTEVPIAGRLTGFILDDLSNEFDPNAPNFGEKYSPPFLPVSIRDWSGREISRVYSDRWGHYNALVPSTFTANLGIPSGMSPSMLITCMNSPGPIPNPDYDPQDPNSAEFIIDPYFNRQYSQFCYTFQYMPGTTTYLDTPVVPIAAYAGRDQFPLDCEIRDGTPVILSVSGPQGGPWVPAYDGTDRLVTVTSVGQVEVPNPAYSAAGPDTRKTIMRDHRFGPSGGTVTVGGVELVTQSWSEGAIIAVVPAEVTTGQLMVTRGDGTSSVTGVTLHVGGGPPIHVSPGGSIQSAIDLAESGDLILVPPGTYEEMLIMWKPVKLQGWGAASTVINAVSHPAEKLVAWRNKLETLVNDGAIDLLPAQEPGAGVLGEPELLFTEEGAGIVVLAKANGPDRFRRSYEPRIDGLGITGADNGGAIFVNAYARWLEISNNKLFSNFGVYGGGIRLGHPFLTTATPNGFVYSDAENENVRIHHNEIVTNGSGDGAGGGVSLCHGSTNYEVVDNFICGNFSQGDGAGIGHYGLSRNGLIAGNVIAFNQSFNQGQSRSGGGLFIGGAAALGLPADGPPANLSPGAGNVVVDGNLIIGNQAGAGDGGGARIDQVNGIDVHESPNKPASWYHVRLYNNIIVDNLAGLAGGGLSLQDAAKIDIHHNTIANNDSTATAGLAFSVEGPTSANESAAQVAGIVSRRHSQPLLDELGPPTSDKRYSEFSNPEMENNIIRGNRSFRFIVCDGTGPEVPAACSGRDPSFLFGLVPDIGAGETAVYDDLGVLGTSVAQSLDPRFSILTDTAGYDASNSMADPGFVDGYVNGDQSQTIQLPEAKTSIAVQPAFDEGGNFIDIHFGPLTLSDPDMPAVPFGDYHLEAGSAAIDAANGADLGSPRLQEDFDGEPRPDLNSGLPDIGADEHPDGGSPPPPAGASEPGTAGGASTWGVATVGNRSLSTVDSSPRGGSRGGRRSLAGPVTKRADLDLIDAPEAPTRADARAVPAERSPEVRTAPAAGAPLSLTPEPMAPEAAGGTIVPVDPSLQPVRLRGALVVQCPGDLDGDAVVDVPDPDRSVKCMHLTAGDGFLNMADEENRRLYMFSFHNVTGQDTATLLEDAMLGAEFPAPTIVLDENDEFYLNLTNVGMMIRPDLFDPHTVHWHGFPEASSVFDGVPDASISINMGATLTYYYNVVEPGTYMYHCHVEATEHMQMGMLGNLYVRPAQNKEGYGGDPATVAQLGGNTDPLAPMGYTYNDGDGSTAYDVEYPIQLGSFDPAFHDASESVQPLPFAEMRDTYPMINGRGYPETVDESVLWNTADSDGSGPSAASQRVHSLIRATQGQRVLLRLSNLNVTRFYTLASLGIPMQVVGKDAALHRGPSGKDLYYQTNSVTLGGGESVDVILDTTDIEPGTYFLYTTNLAYLSNDDEALGGMMTEIVIEAP